MSKHRRDSDSSHVFIQSIAILIIYRVYWLSKSETVAKGKIKVELCL